MLNFALRSSKMYTTVWRAVQTPTVQWQLFAPFTGINILNEKQNDHCHQGYNLTKLVFFLKPFLVRLNGNLLVNWHRRDFDKKAIRKTPFHTLPLTLISKKGLRKGTFWPFWTWLNREASWILLEILGNFRWKSKVSWSWPIGPARPLAGTLGYMSAEFGDQGLGIASVQSQGYV